jgi:hypothetical protein
MNDAPLPTDPQLGAQLARRAVGRVPDDLLAEVLTAVDSAPQTRTDSRWSRPIWRVPRLAAAGIGLTLVVALAVAVAVPGLRGGPAASPAGYPTDRALTTSELATLLAGPALATNTALVAEVTIDAETDVCPMNSYPTIGVIEGMGSQVCVMGAGVSARLTAAKASGTFAFRYLGPGYLGLLGEITPASSSRLAFSVADQWPGADETFLVDGWLGGDYWPCPTAFPMTVGDPLNPTGTDPCHLSWLADDPNAYAGASLTMPAPPEGGVEVGASGMREIDSVPYGSPVHGVFVVRSVTEPCPSDPVTSSRGCSTWRVLAIVPSALPAQATASATPLASATASPTAPETPVADPSGLISPAPMGVWGPGNRPLTAGEFATLWAADPAHLAGQVAVVKGPVPASFSCGPAGVAAGASTVSCQVEVSQGQIAADGHYWAVRVGSDGKLSVVGEIATPKSGFVFTLDQRVRADGSLPDGLAILDAWLDWEPSLYCDTPPYPTGSDCYGGAVWTVLTSAPLTTQPAGYPDMQAPPPGVMTVTVGIGDYQRFGSSDIMTRPIHALFLISGGKILARVGVATLP